MYDSTAAGVSLVSMLAAGAAGVIVGGRAGSCHRWRLSGSAAGAAAVFTG